ncbi:hypothetical protein CYMTET_20353, partial [Cymbomonas tetramitiformis]
VPEQVETLKAPVVIAVGTPNRVLKLVEMGALKLLDTAVVALDLLPDAKKRTVLDLPETRTDFWNLYKGFLQKQVLAKSTQFCLF